MFIPGFILGGGEHAYPRNKHVAAARGGADERARLIPGVRKSYRQWVGALYRGHFAPPSPAHKSRSLSPKWVKAFRYLSDIK